MIFLAIINWIMLGYCLYCRSVAFKATERVSKLELILTRQNNKLSQAKEVLDSVVGKPTMARQYNPTQSETNYLN